MPFQDQSVPILNITDERITINTIALKEILKRVGNHHFAFYSMNGPRRTGKSFMLNNFLRFLKASENKETGLTCWLQNSLNSNRNDPEFQWRGGDQRNTRGIDVWSEPFWVHRNDKKVALLLMDTQGTFDDQTTVQQNACIFAISALLSSVLIFNIMRDISEDVLQFFEFFMSYAALTDRSRTSNCEDFQNLIFLVRDFQFIKDYQYGFYNDKIMPQKQVIKSGLNFKHEKLDAKPQQPKEVKFIRKQLSQSFKNIGVYLLPEPGRALKLNDGFDNLEEDFVIHVEEFVHLVLFKELVTKKVGGLEVTGIQMMKYVDAWAKCFDRVEIDEMPEIKGIYKTTAEQQFIMAKQSAVAYYSSEMQIFLRENSDGVANSELLKKQVELTNLAEKIYKGRRKICGNEYDQKFQKDFSEETSRLDGSFASANTANFKAAEVRRECMERNRRVQLLALQQKLKLEQAEAKAEEVRREYMERIRRDQEQLLASQQALRQKQAKEAKAAEELSKARHELERARAYNSSRDYDCAIL